jgi:putative effector of murein hydrolase
MFRRRRFLQGAKPIQASLRDVAMGLAGGMAGHAAGVGFAAFLQKYPSVGRLFGR